VLVVVGVLVVALAVVITTRLVFRKSPYEQAIQWLPQSSLRVSFTDWSKVRTIAGGTALGARSAKGQVTGFLNRAYDQDLTTASALSDSTYTLIHKFGFSPLDAQWEIYGQSRQGSVDVLQLDDSVNLAPVERDLRRLGYRPPAGGPGTGGTWVGSPDLIAGIDTALTPVEQNVTVLPDQHVVLMSDSPSYAETSANVITGDAPSVADVDGVSDLVGASEDPVNSVLWARDFACADLSMGDAGAEDQRVGDQLVRRAGGITPLTGLMMAQQANRDLVVGMRFESSDEASANLQPRVDLASGAAPGQGGTFRERFSITKAQADGQDVVMRFRPRNRESLLSDISTGPVLFATC
jgi:hypothetical protein